MPLNNCFNLGQFENHSPLDELKIGETNQNKCNCEDKIILKHIGHIGTVSDFDWNNLAPWTIISASDDAEPFNQLQRHNESSLQIFRPLDLLIMTEEEAQQAFQETDLD